MKKITKLLMVAFTIAVSTSCNETSTPEASLSYLSSEDEQAIEILSGRFNALLKQQSTFSFMKSYAKQVDKKSFMIDYLTPTFNHDELKLAVKIIDLLTISQQQNNLKAMNNNFETSPAVSQLTQELTSQISNTIALASAQDQSPDQLKVSLQWLFANFKTTILESSMLTFVEAHFLEWEHCSGNPGHWACI